LAVALWVESNSGAQEAMDEQSQGNQIRLVLVDDQVLFRASLSRFLSAQTGLEVAGECGTAVEALEILNGSSVDIVLLDLDLCTECGDDLISAGRRAGYRGRFLILGGAVDARILADTLKLGASGIFLKSEAPDRLVQAIRLVASGAVWVDQRVIQLLTDQLVDQPHPDDRRPGNLLTEREEKVLLGILGGLTNRKIGDGMGLSEGTVKTVVQHLFVRAGVRTRSQLVRMALEGSLGTACGLAKRAPNVMPAVASPVSHDTQPSIASNLSPVRPSYG
jgi:DNA-binding NarL/FixJ family response regulator